jgi:glycosyltransferase involved in cell wall biosynthesis
LLHYDIVFIYGNPRLLSNIFASFLLKFLGKKVVIWGQAKTAGPSGYQQKLRLWWWKRFKHIFVYTDVEVEWLRHEGFKSHRLYAMNNGLNQKEINRAIAHWTHARLKHWRTTKALPQRMTLLSCARLTPKNQFGIVIHALSFLKAQGQLITWVVIGDGDQKRLLETLATKAGIQNQIIWCGEIYDEKELAPWFLTADILVHPGAIGLSLQHAMGYGLPVLTHHRSELHMPEFAVFKDGITGMTFEHGSYKGIQSTRQIKNGGEFKIHRAKGL